ncbi:MAG TPA: TolC family protein [Candidatus Ratteibacteria bacterium]|nr:TolC family protein [bacterium]HRR95326.1 TolC family protein [Candidatus Ratteibacteria bacterium]
MRYFLIMLLCFPCFVFSENFFTLPDAIKVAINNNLEIKISEDKIEQAYYKKEEVKTYFFPKFTSSFAYTYSGDSEKFRTDDNLYNLSLSLSQPIYTGKRIKETYEISKENLDNAKLEYNVQLQNLIFNVKKGYFSILQANKFLKTSERYKQMLEKHMDDAKKLFEQGLVTNLDILRTEVSVKNAETQIIQAENLIKISKSNFNYILNNPIDNEFEVEDVLEIKGDKRDYEYWKTLALENRPEIKSMEKLLSIYNRAINVERSNLYPQVYLFYNYNTDRGIQVSPNSWNPNWNTGIALTLDIWNWGETKDKVKQAESEKKQVEKQLEITKKSIELEVKNCYLNLLANEKSIEERLKQMETAEENLRVANLLYQEGMATTTEVIEAATSLTEATNNYSQALYDYHISFAELEKASGKGVE